MRLMNSKIDIAIFASGTEVANRDGRRQEARAGRQAI